MKLRACCTAMTVALVIGLAGCASGADGADPTISAQTATPSEAADPNRQACTDFGNTSLELATLISDGSDSIGQDAWRARLAEVPDRFDRAYLEADGQIAERMNDVIENLPDSLGSLVIDADDYSSDIRRVYNACDAAGHPVSTFATLE